MLKKQTEMAEAMTVNHFHAHLQKETLQTFRNENAPKRKILDDVLIVFGRNNVEPESQAKTKRKWQKFTFDPKTMSVSDFLEKLKG